MLPPSPFHFFSLPFSFFDPSSFRSFAFRRGKKGTEGLKNDQSATSRPSSLHAAKFNAIAFFDLSTKLVVAQRVIVMGGFAYRVDILVTELLGKECSVGFLSRLGCLP